MEFTIYSSHFVTGKVFQKYKLLSVLLCTSTSFFVCFCFVCFLFIYLILLSFIYIYIYKKKRKKKKEKKKKKQKQLFWGEFFQGSRNPVVLVRYGQYKLAAKRSFFSLTVVFIL
eukprot:SAG11_NODE_172_length_13574_cov_14.732690_11_plen_114_part_00